MNRNIYNSGMKSTYGQRSYAGAGRAAPAMSAGVRTRQAIDLQSLPLAMAYVPYQRFENVYSPSDALWIGTLFGDLNLPYCTGGKR